MAAQTKSDDQSEQPSRPDTYATAYPGRFLRAEQLEGKTVTFRLVNVERRTLRGVDGPERKTTITLDLNGKEFQIVAPKINGFALKAMFGDKIDAWIGKRVALFATNKYAPMNGESCIRVYGSPDIDKDIEVDYEMPRRKPVRMTLHAMGSGKKGEQPREPGADG